jgi:hypothetical protein
VFAIDGYWSPASAPVLPGALARLTPDWYLLICGGQFYCFRGELLQCTSHLLHIGPVFVFFKLWVSQSLQYFTSGFPLFSR